jgi:hypothetical protein
MRASLFGGLFNDRTRNCTRRHVPMPVQGLKVRKEDELELEGKLL